MRTLSFVPMLLVVLFTSFLDAADPVPPSYIKGLDRAKLLPQVTGLPELKVELALPDDFIAVSRDGALNLDKGVFWGKKETLDRYLAGEIPLQSCVIAVKVSDTVLQEGPTDFKADGGVKREWKRLGGKKMSIRKSMWGHYPVLSLESVSHGGTHFYLAWVGLNDPDGKTLMFTFLCPDNHNIPTDVELALWYYFLQKTAEAPT